MKCDGTGGAKRKYQYYTCENCRTHFSEFKVEKLMQHFIYDMLEYDMAVKKYFMPILEDKKNGIDTEQIDKEIRELEKQRDRIKQVYIKGIVEMEDFSEDYKLIEEKLSTLNSQKLELVNLDSFNYSPHELLAQRDLEKEKMIRLDTLNPLLKAKWNDMSKNERQEFISKFVETIEIKKDEKNNLVLEKINFRSNFISQLLKFYEAGIFDVAVPVEIENKEYYLTGGRMSEDGLDKYLKKMNEYFETSFYELYEQVDKKTNEVYLEYTPRLDEKMVRFVAITQDKKFPITKENIKDKYGIVSYKIDSFDKNMLGVDSYATT